MWTMSTMQNIKITTTIGKTDAFLFSSVIRDLCPRKQIDYKIDRLHAQPETSIVKRQKQKKCQCRNVVDICAQQSRKMAGSSSFVSSRSCDVTQADIGCVRCDVTMKSNFSLNTYYSYRDGHINCNVLYCSQFHFAALLYFSQQQCQWMSPVTPSRPYNLFRPYIYFFLFENFLADIFQTHQ